ncbi:hypothetical protein [Arsenophonus endosymbiont of Bemisia tabaci]|uniref:hypothetical protein n=1 Tax=Arsenophonus endosymbiont of Bemisia tabaci TaxID=536059 RepID=UPI001EE236BB|nr:hypothetical protein [Arsenophonus endosymbiont of Bemisia tabaci]
MEKNIYFVIKIKTLSYIIGKKKRLKANMINNNHNQCELTVNRTAKSSVKPANRGKVVIR